MQSFRLQTTDPNQTSFIKGTLLSYRNVSISRSDQFVPDVCVCEMGEEGGAGVS